MKAMILLMTVFFVQSVSARGVTPLENKDVSLSQAKAKITAISEICRKIPERASCMAQGSSVTIKVTLGGCFDRFGGFFSHFQEVDGRGVLYFGAVNIFNEKSRSTRCLTAPFHTINLHVPYEGDIELVNIDFTGTSRPQF